MAASNIRVVLDAFNGFTTRLVQRIVLDVTANLIEDTPVDTGWARANWVPSIGDPFTGTAGSAQEARAGVIDRSPQEQGIAQVALGYTLSQGNITISNNVPYIRRLNEGSSSQAPAAFVQSAIARAISNANSLRSP